MVNHIKLYEIAATAKNFEMFKAKYGKDVSDEQLKSIFDRFNKQQSRLQIKYIQVCFVKRFNIGIRNQVGERSWKEYQNKWSQYTCW